jgi:glutamate-1-semialdehyde-2,1-aminomutase
MRLDSSKVMTSVAAISGETAPQPVMQSAEGCRVTDIDNNQYIDLCMGFGANLLGHRPRIVEQAIIDQTAKGWNFGFSSENQLALAELICSAGASNERALLCGSGAEATATAMRAARAYTGKDVIGVFTGAYHGGHDQGLITGDPENISHKVHVGLGIPSALDNVIEPLVYGSSSAFQRIRGLRQSLAAIIVEPVQSSGPEAHDRTWLRDLQNVCHECNVLFILDEVTSGFRLAFGGAQERFGLSPDLVTYGKVMAGGLPMGAIAGRADIMKVFAPKDKTPAVFSGSTFGGNPMSVSAAVSTLSFLREHRDTLYQDLDRAAARLAKNVNARWAAARAPLMLLQYSSIFKLVFKTPKTFVSLHEFNNARRAEDTFFVHLLDRGIALHASRTGYLSTAHTAEDVDFIVEAMSEAFEESAADGCFATTHTS